MRQMKSFFIIRESTEVVVKYSHTAFYRKFFKIVLDLRLRGEIAVRVIGIDPGTAIVGYGIIDYIDNRYEVVDYGCIYTPKEMSMPKRLLKISEELSDLLEKYKPDHMGIEELFFFKNNKTVISVGQARGVIILEGVRKGIELADYTPLQVKMGITGYGRAEKKQVQLMVQKVLKLKDIPKPDDAADALAVAVTHINALKSSSYGLQKMKKLPEKLEKTIKNGKLSAKEYRELLQLK